MDPAAPGRGPGLHSYMNYAASYNIGDRVRIGLEYLLTLYSLDTTRVCNVGEVMKVIGVSAQTILLQASDGYEVDACICNSCSINNIIKISNLELLSLADVDE